MTISSSKKGNATPLMLVQARSSLSLERSHPRRSPREKILLLVDPQAVSYFQDLSAHWHLEDKMVIITMPLAGAVSIVKEKCQKVGPFRRIYLFTPWDGQQSAQAYCDWQEIQAEFLAPSMVTVQLIGYHPSFDFWILLHFEDPTPEANDAAWLAKRVEQLLAHNRSDSPQKGSLFTQIQPHLHAAIQCSKLLAHKQYRILAADNPLPVQSGAYLHAFMSYLDKLAKKRLNANNS